MPELPSAVAERALDELDNSTSGSGRVLQFRGRRRFDGGGLDGALFDGRYRSRLAGS